MDRYVIREPRSVADNAMSNPMIRPPLNMTTNNTVMEPGNMTYGVCGSNALHVQRHQGIVLQNQGQVASGIDPRYLAAYSDANASYIATGKNYHQTDSSHSNQDPAYNVMYNNYENKNFIGPQKTALRKFQHNHQPLLKEIPMQLLRQESNKYGNSTVSTAIKQEHIPSSSGPNWNEQTKKTEDTAQVKNEGINQSSSRFDKLKALNKSGPRVFSGPVEKVLKWHKALQEVGILILYEIVAKCVNVRPGEASAKILVIRDENGPAMQVVYYEIDFLLPELKLPCSVRVIGKILHGTCRLQAYHVRPATGDDVATLPRRAAVAQHHVAKLYKEYSNNS